MPCGTEKWLFGDRAVDILLAFDALCLSHLYFATLKIVWGVGRILDSLICHFGVEIDHIYLRREVAVLFEITG